MRTINKRFFIFITLLIFVTVFFVACDFNDDIGEQDDNDKKIDFLSVNVPDQDFIIGEIDFSDILITIHYDNDTTDTVYLTEDMVLESSKPLLEKEGTRQINIAYKGYSAVMTLKLVRRQDKKYTLNLIGGYVSAINGKELISPHITTNGETFTDNYPSGTVLTIHWIDENNKFFDYWTINDVKGAKDSIISVTLNSNVTYKAYTTSVVNNVSFVTGFDDLAIKSKTTNILNLADVNTIQKDGYVFLGWTTDVISQTQSHQAYSKNIVNFPYKVTRDVVLYGVWTPIGIDYIKIAGEYGIKKFNGNITELIIPETYMGIPVTKIFKTAFETESGKLLTSVYLAKSIKEIEAGAFKNCQHLEKIIANESENFMSIDGVLYSADKKQLLAYPSSKMQSVYAVENDTEKIGDFAFFNAELGGIELSSSISEIGDGAFYGYHVDFVDLLNVNPIGLVVGNNIFHSNIAKVRVSAGMKYSFCGISQFNGVLDKIITENDELTKTGIFETKEADGKESKTLYRIIENDNFHQNGEVVEIIGVSRNIDSYTLQVNIGGYSVVSIGDHAFHGCDNLTHLRIPSGSKLERICDGAFEGTQWVETLENDAIIANFIFYKYLGNEQSVVLDSGITEIAEGAFAGNKFLKNIDISNNATLKDISAYAFYECDNFKGFIWADNTNGDKVFLKKSIHEIGAYAFYGTKINAVELQTENNISINSWERIGDFAFANCLYLQSVKLSSAMKDISETAFLGCVSLEKFVLTEENQNYAVYDGVLYQKNGMSFTLFTYPSGRLDAEFNPSIIKNYITKIDCNENNYLSSSQTDGDIEIGKVFVNGKQYELYMAVYGYDKSMLQISDDGLIKTDMGKYLTETTAFVETETDALVPNGQKLYSFINSKGDRQYLFYDIERNTYFYMENLNVTQYGEYSLQFSNITALIVSKDVLSIEEKAINIPGLVYIKFESTPVMDYHVIFSEYEPKYVIMPDSVVSVSSKKKFYGNDESLMAEKDRNNSPYEFFYANDANGVVNKTVLYAFNIETEENIKISVAKTSRQDQSLHIPDNLYRGTELISSKKNIMSFAFYGVNLESVYLRKINELESNAFSKATSMTFLDLNSDFIAKLGKNVFGSKLNNGLYIHDYINGVDLYQTTENWGLEFLQYTTPDGSLKYFSRYLIKDKNGAFAVIVNKNQSGEETIGIKYGTITVNDVQELQNLITVTGYDISEWMDLDGNIIRADCDYIIPYNQILKCNLIPQSYEILLYSSPSISFDLEIQSTNETGLICYKTEVIYDSEYSFTPVSNPDSRKLFWRIQSQNNTFNDIVLSDEGTWEIECFNGLELYAIIGYKVICNLNNINAKDDFKQKTEYLFNGETYELGKPESIDGTVFQGWYYQTDTEEIRLTDENGVCLSGWGFTDKNDYTVYAKWE